jgi:Tfp pilus assembly protein PilV
MKRRASAFTFVEVLAALLFLGITIPAVVGALMTAGRAATVSERRAIATELGENLLSELMIDNAWKNASSRGEFSADYPGYRYEMTQANWKNDTAMTELMFKVLFKVQGQEYEVQLTTLVNDQLTDTDETTTGTTR